MDFIASAMGQSIHGRKADDLFATIKTHLDEIEPGRFDSCLKAFQEAASSFDHFMKATNATLILALFFIILAASFGLLGFKFLRLAKKISRTSETLGHANEIQKNLKYQREFARCVHNFVVWQIKLHTNDGSSEELFSGSNEQDQPQGYDHYFLVYHPGSDWHASFHALIEGNMPGFVGLCNTVPSLLMRIQHLRSVVHPTAVIHVLLPSAHIYDISDEIVIQKNLLPLKFHGQRHYTGRPYCCASIRGVEHFNVVDVGSLEKRAREGSESRAWFWILVLLMLCIAAWISG